MRTSLIQRVSGRARSENRLRSTHCRRRLTLQRLDDRHLLAGDFDFLVTTIADVVDPNDGVLSLREAITQANTEPNRQTIGFADNVRGTLTLSLGELVITDSLTLHGPGQSRLSSEAVLAVSVVRLAAI